MTECISHVLLWYIMLTNVAIITLETHLLVTLTDDYVSEITNYKEHI